MTEALFRLLCRRWVTNAIAAQMVNCYSLSQRCGQFRRQVNVVDEWVHQNGKHYKRYRIVGARG